jgi:hypothetical protein
MSLDLFAIGPPKGGLFLFGRKAAPRDDSATASGEKGARAEAGEASRPDRHHPFNHHIQAIHNELKMEHQRQVLAPLFTAPSRSGVGALIDLRA